MNKTELINYCAEQCEISKKNAGEIVENMINIVTDILASGESISILGFGTLGVKDRAERQGVNPKTGTPITIAASKTVTFKAGKGLKTAVNS